MRVNVEFTGISSVLTGQKGCSLSLNTGDTIREVVIGLAQKFPVMVGEVIEKDGKTLIPTNVFSLNGKKILHENDLQFQPQDGDRLILLSLLAGG
jgi:hypothetical protein